VRALFVRPQKSTAKPWLWVLASAALVTAVVGAWRPAGLSEVMEQLNSQLSTWWTTAPEAPRENTASPSLDAPVQGPVDSADNTALAAQPNATATGTDLLPQSGLKVEPAPAHALGTPVPNLAQTTERLTEAPSIELQVASFVEQWASGWSNKNTEAYFGCYDKSFTPEGAKRLAEWRQEREQRITSKKQITVAIKDLVVLPTSPAGWRANFVQVYEADGFKSTSAKTLLLSRSDGHWKITREFTP